MEQARQKRNPVRKTSAIETVKSVYTLNYLKIYLWQGIAMALGILSMVIVTPLIAGVPSIYGIYSVCISLTIFLSYADIGFVGAGSKYASESLARKDGIEELKIAGFVSFVLFVFVAIFSVIVFVFASNPDVLVKNIRNGSEREIATHLLMILAVFSPAVVLQRFLQIVYGIRLEEYIFQRLNILSSIAKIVSVFYFFHGSRYDIVGFFLFSQCASTVASGIGLHLATKRYGYSYLQILRSFRFSVILYNKIRTLAFGTLFLTLTWILFFELDVVAIARFLGTEDVALYAVALNLVVFFRGLYATLYGPFQARFNHFIGVKDYEGLKSLYRKVMLVTAPLVVFPILSVAILAKPLLLSWVGPGYEQSTLLLQLLVTGFICNFIAQPTSIILVAFERMKSLYALSAALPLIFWVGILSTVRVVGLPAFAFFKCIAFLVSGIWYTVLSIRYLEMKPTQFLKEQLSSMTVPTLIQVVILLCVVGFMPIEKAKVNLFLVVLTGAMSTIAAIGAFYFISMPFRTFLRDSLFAKLKQSVKIALAR